MDYPKVKRAQVTLEFTLSFICLLLILVLTAKLFVWFGRNIVWRQRAYENTRTTAGRSGPAARANRDNFYTATTLDIFN